VASKMRQRAVSRLIAWRKETFYQSIPQIAGSRGGPYDAPALSGTLTDIT
jgi:hypothetical protein